MMILILLVLGLCVIFEGTVIYVLLKECRNARMELRLLDHRWNEELKEMDKILISGNPATVAVKIEEEEQKWEITKLT